ncbi:MAG TPA: hypothetical protein VMU05_11235 [Dongiaceae bacterium]|nr:hypothetical protein [Dongiaceae bacterium]
MQRLLKCVLALGCLGTSAMLVQRDITTRQSDEIETRMLSNAAYRDGLYLGKLARAAKREMRPPVGRWSRAEDRASFAAGYRLGFKQHVDEE